MQSSPHVRQTSASSRITVSRAAAHPQDLIRLGSSEILSLVEDALAVGFSGTGQFTLSPAPVRLRADVLRRSWEGVRMQKRFAEKVRGLQMSLEVAPNVPERTLLDRARLCQVIQNLVSNAVKFVSPMTGIVRLTATFAEEAGLLTITVEDNGRGMTQEGMSKCAIPAAGSGSPTTFGVRPLTADDF